MKSDTDESYKWKVVRSLSKLYNNGMKNKNSSENDAVQILCQASNDVLFKTRTLKSLKKFNQALKMANSLSDVNDIDRVAKLTIKISKIF